MYPCGVDMMRSDGFLPHSIRSCDLCLDLVDVEYR